MPAQLVCIFQELDVVLLQEEQAGVLVSECQLFADKGDGNGRAVGLEHDAQGTQPHRVDEFIEENGAHVRRGKVQLEKEEVVLQGEGALHLKRVLHVFMLLLLVTELLDGVKHLFHSLLHRWVKEVQDAVG